MQGLPNRSPPQSPQAFHQHPRGHRHAPQQAKPTKTYNPRLPVRQWVLSVPKRIRYYLQRDKGALNAALRIFLRVVQQSLVAACPGAAKADSAHLHLGAVASIHRFGSSLNTHVHFHVCVVDGVFEALPGAQADAASIKFHPAQIDEAAITQMQAKVQNSVRKRLLRAFVARGQRPRRAGAPAALLCAAPICHGATQAARR